MSYYNWQAIFKRAYRRNYRKRNLDLVRRFADYSRKEPPLWLASEQEEARPNFTDTRQKALRYLLDNCDDRQLIAILGLERRYRANEIEF